MNTIKKNLIKDYMENNADDAFEIGFSDGFDACLSLDISVKFAIFCNGPMPTEAKNIIRKNGSIDKELFDYYINNVYEK